MYDTNEFVKSWKNLKGNVNSTESILKWVEELNRTTQVEIEETTISEDTFWKYDSEMGMIRNQNKSFFCVAGIKEFQNGELLKEQPIILQQEIGILGILCKKFNGVWNFLMQAKIEPGNINCIQLSPTIQATKSNFTRAHGGKSPQYLDYFVDANKYEIIYDQLQSEQGGRFYHKRNRNMIVALNDDENVEEKTNFKWMTLGQIKELLKIENLVNMDSRTVLSGIPFYKANSNAGEQLNLPCVYNKLNDFKMYADYRTELCKLEDLKNWKMQKDGIFCEESADFEVRYYNIMIEGREVRQWMQPLFKAKGIALFGLISSCINNRRQYLVKIQHEIGTLDEYELGPSVQLETTEMNDQLSNPVDVLFEEKMSCGDGIIADILLSEEGGRFYHEQNRNVIIDVSCDEIPELGDEYLWVDFPTLTCLVQNCYAMNIQLRNLVSLVDSERG